MTGDIPFQNIIKRDGRVLPFHAEKIAQAIFKAARAVGGEDYSLAEGLTREVLAYLSRQNLPGVSPTVEEIQDAVEKVLIEKGHARTAKAYILYRAKRTRIREAKSELMDVVKDILIDGNHEDKEESGYSPAKKMNRVAIAASQKYYLDNLLPQDLAEAHRMGNFHIHQLGYYSKSIDSLKVDLASYFGDIAVNERHLTAPVDLSTALFTISALAQKAGNDLHGEISLACFDSFLSTVVDGLAKSPDTRLLTASLRGFLHYLSTFPCFRGSNHQSKFSIELGRDLTAGGRKVTRIVLEELIGGKKVDGQQPRIIFGLKKGVNFLQSDPNYDLYKLALKAALASGNPAFVFLDTSYNNFVGACSSYFSDGSRIAVNRGAKTGGKKRGNIGSLTVNLPRLALQTGGQDLFFVELDRLLRLGVRQLLHRFEVLTALRCREFPALMGWNLYHGSRSLSPEESIEESIKNGSMLLNYTGLPETVRVLLNKGEMAGRFDLAKKIVLHMARRVESFSKEYGLNFALGSIAGGELKRLVELDRKDFGLIEGVTDKTSYSSSFVLFQEDEGLERKIVLEGDLHKLCSGGYVSKAVFLPRLEPQAIEDFIYKLVEAEIGFLSVFKLG